MRMSHSTSRLQRMDCSRPSMNGTARSSIPKPTIGQSTSRAPSVAESSLRGLRPHWTYKRALRPFRGLVIDPGTMKASLSARLLAREWSQKALFGWRHVRERPRALKALTRQLRGREGCPLVGGSPYGGLEAKPPSPAPTWTCSRVETEAATKRRDA